MRIGIDATGFGPTKTGTVSYLTEILACWNADQQLDHQFFIFVSPKAAHHLHALGLDSRFVLVPAPDNRHGRVLWQQLILPFKIARLQLDVHWGTAFVLPLVCTTPMVVTVHDLTFELFPQHHERIKRIYFPAIIRASVRRATRVLAISAATREDLYKLIAYSRGKTTVTLLAARSLESQNAQPASQESSPYVLFLGTLEPRKNLARLLQAWRSLSPDTRKNWTLRIIGTSGWLMPSFGSEEDFKAYGIEFLGQVDDAELSGQLQQAQLLAYPSLYEGFGLPVIEAMRLGVPVLTSDVGATKEIAADAACLVDPGSVSSIAQGLTSLLQSPTRRQQLAQKGRARAAEFSWQKTAQLTLSSLLKSRPEK